MNITPKLSLTFALLTILVGMLSIFGWFFHVPILYTFLSNGASMKFNTSLVTILVGVSIVSATSNSLVLARVLGLIIIIFCALTTTQYALDLNLHIDELLMIDHLTNSIIEPPGRMSLYTTISFFIITIGSELALFKKYFASQIITSIGLLISYISFIGVLFNISGLFSFGSYSAIAFPTTLSLISSSLASLFYTSDKGWLSEVASKHSAAVTTRYALLYFFLSLPIFIGLFLLMLSKARLPAEVAVVILIISFATLTLPFAYILLKKLNRSDERSFKLMNELEDRSKQLHANNSELEDRNKELDSLLHIISHDLKTPIATLRASLDIIERKLAAQLQEKELKLLTISKNSISHMTETIQSLGEIIKTKQLANPILETIDLCLLINDIILELQGTIEETHAEILVNINECEFYYERIHLHSIIQNLITNALKFRHPGRPPVVSIAALKVEGSLRLSVTDNGLGIPEKQKHNLFSKYIRFHHHLEGTGIGLYLIKQFIDRTGGSIEVMSEEDKGTTFTVVLPSLKN